MSGSEPQEVWTSGASYERYVGRWSGAVARILLDALAMPPDCRWLDVGCGTGVLSQMILSQTSPRAVSGMDRSLGYLAFARRHVVDRRASFVLAEAQELPIASAAFDVAISGLVLNFVPDPLRMVAEMVRAVRPNGVVALYVWDYAEKMELMRYFWDAVAALNPSAHGLDEGVRFPICKPEPLAELFRKAGLHKVTTQAIDITTDFRDFDDYWSPFLSGEGPAPAYVMSLSEPDRTALRDQIRVALPIESDGSIHLPARAWAVSGLRD